MAILVLFLVGAGLVAWAIFKKPQSDSGGNPTPKKKFDGPVFEVLRPFGRWNWNRIYDEGRMKRSVRYHPIPGTLDKVNECCLMQGNEDEPYEVSLRGCACKDFSEKFGGSVLLSMPLPCKHIYALAHELGYIRVKMTVLAPLSLPLYQCDSGGYMSSPLYGVTYSAIRESTNKKNKRYFLVNSLDNIETDVEAEAKKDGMMAPIEILEIAPAHSPATERQLSYAADIGLYIPNGATKEDVSAMLDRFLSSDHTPPSNELVRFFLDRKIPFSRMANHKHLEEKRHRILYN